MSPALHSRRAMLATVALAAAPAPLPSSPDAELLAAHAAFDALERQFVTLHGELTEIEDQIALVDVIHRMQKPHLDKIVALKATTREGLRARIRTVLLQDTEVKPAETLATSPYVNERLLAVLLRDLAIDAGIGGAA